MGLNIRGDLKIGCLENVRDPVYARRANMIDKEYIQSLHLSWNDDAKIREQSHGRVMECLRPHGKLKRLKIENYMGPEFPQWMMNSSVLHLVEVSLIDCKRSNKLPHFAQMSSLKKLKIIGMPNLEKWSSVVEERELFPSIEELELSGCLKLTSLPILPSLKKLALDGCNEVLLGFATDCTSIKSLDLSSCQFLTSLPSGILQQLTSLEELSWIELLANVFAQPYILMKN